MTPALFLALSVAGGFGAATRLVVDGLIRSRVDGVVPWGTVFINLSGSFLLGVLAGLAGARVLPEHWQTVLGTGLLGGYTTFSTASFETVRLAQEGRPGTALAKASGTVVGAAAAAAAGWWFGARL
ncbi:MULTISPECIES: fluoride efflux transporter CrcB [Aestuariimicrobium]|uniref:fluoride efflux transporter CrcB n=1 Tax=Aestuariimicrobium TaxID=396388 RepID=UPI0003B306C2|nr:MULTISPECIES: fluoride efflux transporter CrcB [Aestuariimicrobium]CAI9411414.1 Putative fluoride ion transporter CrcB [Aestuariimicrobium sp. T2.26MG-19.2B]